MQVQLVDSRNAGPVSPNLHTYLAVYWCVFFFQFYFIRPLASIDSPEIGMSNVELRNICPGEGSWGSARNYAASELLLAGKGP